MATPTAPKQDALLSEQPVDIVERAAAVGEERLRRSALDIFVTAVIGGVEVSLGGLAAAAVLGASLTAVPRLGLFGGLAIAAIVFPVGFLFVILGRSELFTENFLIPVVSLVRHTNSWLALVELWALSWLGNLAGCAVMALLISIPDSVGSPVHAGLDAYATYKLGVPSLGVLASAVLAGITMTVLTWMLIAVQDMTVKIVAIFAAGYLLFAANLAHAIVGAALIFAGWPDTGRPLIDVVRWLGLATVGNLVGGVAFVTVFRVIQAHAKEHPGR